MKLGRNRMPVRTVVSVGKLLPLNLLLVAGLFLSTTQAKAQGVDDNGPPGVYTLVTVNGSKLPAKVSHGDVAIQVRSGTFTINADGTCSSKVVFGSPSGDDVTRKVNATYTREGAELNMQWEGAGKTAGTFEGDSFTMNNEGMIFAYKKQPATPASQDSSASPPEMKALERLVGTWKVEQIVKVPEDAGSTNLVVKRELILGGRFVQEMGGFDDKGKPTFTAMYTYDSNRKTYRYWFFLSSGFYWEPTGTWDESSQTFTFKGGLGADATRTMTMTLRFSDEATFVFTLVTTNPDGEISYHSEGKCVRQKKNAVTQVTNKANHSGKTKGENK